MLEQCWSLRGWSGRPGARKGKPPGVVDSETCRLGYPGESDCGGSLPLDARRDKGTRASMPKKILRRDFRRWCLFRPVLSLALATRCWLRSQDVGAMLELARVARASPLGSSIRRHAGWDILESLTVGGACPWTPDGIKAQGQACPRKTSDVIFVAGASFDLSSRLPLPPVVGLVRSQDVGVCAGGKGKPRGRRFGEMAVGVSGRV